MKPATEGQFHQVIAKLLTNTPYKEIQFKGIQSLIADPERLVEEFSRFLSYGGIFPIECSFPIWKVMRIPNEPLPAHLYRLDCYEIIVDEIARTIINKWQPEIPEKKRGRYFVKVTPAMLGMSEYNSDEFYSRAYHEYQLSLCGAHDTLYLRSKYREEEDGQKNPINIAVVPWKVGDIQYIFSLRADESPKKQYYLNAVNVKNMNINSEFIFEKLVK